VEGGPLPGELEQGRRGVAAAATAAAAGSRGGSGPDSDSPGVVNILTTSACIIS